MASVGTIWSNLKLNISGFSRSLNTAASQLKAFSKNVNGQTNNAAQAMKALRKEADAYGLTLKSTSRIISGILISQAFYKGVQSIRDAERAVWDFSSSLEYAQIAYTNLFNDNDLAEEFINVLKDFAAVSPFDFTESEQAAKRLLAYGVQYKNVMYIMQGVMSAAAMQGDSTKVESISRALGQIYTKGRLMNEEMRQLAEAGIPAYEILREKLGLTQEQLQSLGNESIPASKAINALVDGMTERFGNVTTAATKTMTGIISNIRDNATMLATNAFDPLYTKIKGVANALGEWLYTMREISETQGMGGVFEAIVPESLRSTIKMFIANFMNLLHAIGNVVQALNAWLKPAILGVVQALNVVLPVVNTVVGYLSAFLYVLAQNEAIMKTVTAAIAAATAMWLAYKSALLVAAVASKAIALMSAAVKGLSTALTFVVAHPFWALMLVMIGTIAVLTGTFNQLSDAIRSTFASLTSLSGVDPDQLLLPSQKERTNDISKFNEALDTTADSMDELAENTNKAKKNLLSFDEVYKLNDTNEGATSGVGIDIDIPDVDFGDQEAWMPDVPDFTGWTNDYIRAFQEAVGKIKEAVSGWPIGAMLGAMLGASIGGLIGGPAGAALGGAIGALVGQLMQEIAEYIETGDISGISTSLGGLIGLAIGGVLGGPGGALIGAAIGTLVGGLLDMIIIELGKGDSPWVGPLSLAFGGILGAAIGFVVGGPAGAAIGAAIGSLVGWVGGEIADGIVNGNWDGVSLSLGAGLGAAIGAIVGGPMGAAIGLAIGSLVGWLVGLVDWKAVGEAFLEPLTNFGGLWGGTSEMFGVAKEFFDHIKVAFEEQDWLRIGGDILGGILFGLVGAISAIFEPILRVFAAIINAFLEVFGIHSPAKEMEPIGENVLLGLLEGLVGAITAIPEYIKEVGLSIIKTMGDWFMGIGEKVTDWLSDGVDSIKNFVSDTKEKFTNWATETGTKISTWASNTKSKIVTWATDTKSNVSTWATNTKEKISTWATDTKEKVSSWWTNVKGKFDSFKDISFTSWCESTLSTISTWANNVWNGISDKIGKAVDKVKEFFGFSNSTDFNVNATVNGTSAGHATGGIFNREHVARFAEGDKAEAIIPLENNSAMQPFVDAVSNGLTASLAPIIANIGGNSQQLQPLYVGTLIADDRSLKELERKMKVIRLQEERR